MEKIKTYDYDPVDFIKTDAHWVNYLNVAPSQVRGLKRDDIDVLR